MTTRFVRPSRRRKPQPRTGTILPGVVVALIVTICCLALVLDKLWLDAASTELRTASEAAAFAAARELVHDHLLCEDYDSEERIKAARRRALEVAWENPVAGQPVELDATPEGDIRFGRLVYDSDAGRMRFLQTEQNPRTVVVTSCRLRSRGNPVALWFRGITKQGTGNAVSRAEVTAENQIVGVRPFQGVPVPALPLAILECDPTGQRADTWENQIVLRNGADNYRFNAEMGSVEPGQDGIPEIHLHSKKKDESAFEANVQLVDLNTDLRTDPLLQQFEEGWTADALEEFDGELHLDTEGRWMTSLAALDWDHAGGLEQLIGQPRICLLYSDMLPTGDEGYGKLRAVKLVAGRIMAVRCEDEGQHVLIFQPTVLTTRTAVLANARDEAVDLSPAEQKLLENPYIYKLHLTR